MRQTGSYYHTTPQSYCSPKPSSSTRQHHEREAAHLRCIGAYNPSPRIARAGCVDAYTPTTPHQPSPTATRRKLTTLSPHGVLLSVVVHGSSVHFSSYYACLLSPFAYLCTRLSPRSVSAVRAAIYTGFFWYVCATTVYCFFCYNRQQHAVSVISTVSREDSSSIDLKQLVGGS